MTKRDHGALGDLPAGEFGSWANDVSADGQKIVGYGSTGTALVDIEAVLWHGGVPTGLGGVPGQDPLSIAHAITPDGSVIVGAATFGEGGAVGFRREGGVNVALENLPDADPTVVAIALVASEGV